MSQAGHGTWVKVITHLTTRRITWTLPVVGVVTMISLVSAERLQLKMKWTDLLPSHNRTVRIHHDILARFGEASIVVALQGDRDSIVAMAQESEPRLAELQSLRNLLGEMPSDFLLDHGFMLLKPEQL